jgi:hypothetical protein
MAFIRKYIGFLLILLKGYSLNAQQTGVDSLEKQFHDYQRSAPQEKIFVHTDKTFYLTGETIWFKIYLVDASFHKPTDISHIGYVEILDADHRAVLQTRISIKSGLGKGYMNVPGSIHSGHYILRAYTAWMKNFSPDFYFEQMITIENALVREAAPMANKQPSSIQFFPEGGSLLNGFSSRIAFKAVDSNGMGVQCKGFVMNQKKDTVAFFESIHLGMGSFLFKPMVKENYYAVVFLDGRYVQVKLPDPQDQGVCMNVSVDESDRIKVRVRATDAFENTDIFCFAQTRQVVKDVQSGKLINGEFDFTISRNHLSSGISTITIFDAQRRPVCERLVFKKPEDTLMIRAGTDQDSYEKRKPVQVDLLTESSQQHVSANLSMSVFKLDDLQPLPDQDILSYLYLRSDLKGNIECPEYYFASGDKKVDQAMDVLLLTQGWRRFQWEDIIQKKKPFFEFTPELEGPVINGRLIHSKTNEVVVGQDVIFSVPGIDDAFSITTSDDQGMVRFAFPDIHKNYVAVIQPAFNSDSNARLEMGSIWAENFSSLLLPSWHAAKTMHKELLDRSVDNQIENTYAVEKKNRYLASLMDSSSFYGRADKIYFLDNYTRYQTMEEVMREYVIDVRVRKENSKYIFRVKNSLTALYFEGLPLLLLDGIPINDATKIIELDPLKIKKIEVVAHPYYFGSSVLSGIINVKSYSNDLSASRIDPRAVVLEYGGIQESRMFYSPSHQTTAERQSRLPDFRNVLDWSPEILTDRNGKSQVRFFTSDVKGRFAVVIQGIDFNGHPGKSIIHLNVVDSR